LFTYTYQSSKIYIVYLFVWDASVDVYENIKIRRIRKKILTRRDEVVGDWWCVDDNGGRDRLIRDPSGFKR
jgi:hypothetical protein